MTNAEAPLDNAAEVESIDVSFVIVSWNVADLLGKCIESIVRDAGPLSVEVLVVDNASHDHTVAMLRDKFPWVQLIANNENVGFARANNRGFLRARGRYVLVLNPDTVLIEGALKAMLEAMGGDSQVGMVGARLVYPDGKVQRACARLLPTLLSSLLSDTLRLIDLPLIGRWLARRYCYPYDYRSSQYVQAVSGAAMLLRREVLTAVRGFGECFAHCGEDVDLCYRVSAEGWRVYYCANARVVHYHGESTRQVPVRTWVNSTLSKGHYYRRCYGRLHGGLYRISVYAIGLPAIITLGCIKLALGRESSTEFNRRLEIARRVWEWKELT